MKYKNIWNKFVGITDVYYKLEPLDYNELKQNYIIKLGEPELDICIKEDILKRLLEEIQIKKEINKAYIEGYGESRKPKEKRTPSDNYFQPFDIMDEISKVSNKGKSILTNIMHDKVTITHIMHYDEVIRVENHYIGTYEQIDKMVLEDLYSDYWFIFGGDLNHGKQK